MTAEDHTPNSLQTKTCDRTSKNDGERHAAKRFVTKLRKDHPHLKCIVTEDSLSSNAPHIQTLWTCSHASRSKRWYA
jgi:hypothetical protein